MDDEYLQNEISESSHSNSNAYNRARKKMKELRGFYNHLIVFIIINTFLVIVNILTSPERWWFYWITISWGFGLVWHGVSIYMKRGLLSKEWEEKKIKEYIEKEEK